MKNLDDGYSDGTWNELNQLIRLHNPEIKMNMKEGSPFNTFGEYRNLPDNTLWGNRDSKSNDYGTFVINVSDHKMKKP